MRTTRGTEDGRRWSRPWSRWFTGPAGESTTTAVERTIALIVIGLRVGVVAQMAPSLHRGWLVSPAPSLYLVCWVAAAASSIAVAVLCVVRRRPPGDRVLLADLSVTVGLVLASMPAIGPDDRLGSWTGFLSGYSIAVLITAATMVSAAWWLIGTVALLAALTVHVEPLLSGDVDGVALVTSNIVTYVCFAIVVRLTVPALRRMARDSDDARRRAAELARQDELRRARLAFHNGVAVMRLLAEAEAVSGTPHHGLREQARAESHRMRAYLGGGPPSATASADEAAQLEGAVAEGVRGFDDLGLETVTDLAQGVSLAPATARALAAALMSLMLNVRRHADAERVVVHADADEHGWTVTVHDDGRGFDADRTQLGVGLRDVVVAGLREHDVRVMIESGPGLGTLVTMEGAR